MNYSFPWDKLWHMLASFVAVIFLCAFRVPFYMAFCIVLGVGGLKELIDRMDGNKETVWDLEDLFADFAGVLTGTVAVIALQESHLFVYLF